jgi:alpha-tubulin suppressor-like RCC1 family protein
VAIACGGNHNLVITASNDVYTWGYGDMLALGHGLEADEPLPKRINFSKAKIGGTVSICLSIPYLCTHINIIIYI